MRTLLPNIPRETELDQGLTAHLLAYDVRIEQAVEEADFLSRALATCGFSHFRGTEKTKKTRLRI